MHATIVAPHPHQRQLMPPVGYQWYLRRVQAALQFAQTQTAPK
jgi:hypothetical protein